MRSDVLPTVAELAAYPAHAQVLHTFAAMVFAVVLGGVAFAVASYFDRRR